MKQSAGLIHSRHLSPIVNSEKFVNSTAILLRALSDSASLMRLSLSEWDNLICVARSAGLLARLHAILIAQGSIAYVPRQAATHLAASGTFADHERRILVWEVNRIERTLRTFDGPIILLKGAAYVVSNLTASRGRISSDVDILVPKAAIEAVEKALLSDGWEHVKLDDYDQLLYRRWSHELPPLQHRDRGTVVDVHHTILPPIGRLHPDPEKLLAASIPVNGTKFRVLAPADMLLHSAAHAFQDGDLTRGLRDLVDIDDLLRHFSKKEGFWDELLLRGEELDLRRPLYYAIRYSHRYLETPIPEHVLDRLKKWRAAWPASRLMDAFVEEVLTAGPWRKNFRIKLSQRMLYIRAHWLRMPPHLLIPHLVRKAVRKRSLQKCS